MDCDGLMWRALRCASCFGTLGGLFRLEAYVAARVGRAAVAHIRPGHCRFRRCIAVTSVGSRRVIQRLRKPLPVSARVDGEERAEKSEKERVVGEAQTRPERKGKKEGRLIGEDARE